MTGRSPPTATRERVITPSERSRHYLGAMLAWMIGLGRIVALIIHQDVPDLLSAMAAAGWLLPVLSLSYAGTLLLDSLGWRAVIPNAERIGLIALITRRWVASSVNALLPVAQIGGEVVRARLLTRLGLPVILAAGPDGFGVKDITGLPWIEIDFPEDLRHASNTVFPKLLNVADAEHRPY